MIRQQQVTVTVSPTLLVQPGFRHISDPMSVAIRNGGADSIFLGGSDVAVSGASGGFELTAGSVIVMTLLNGDETYGITASGTQVAQIMRLRNPS